MSRKSIVDRKKGKSLLVIPRDYTLVDLETTGFSSLFDDIIEVGLIKIRDGKETDRYQSLVKPSKPIPYIIECVTGIKNDMVANAPTFENIGKDVWSFLENEVIVGHNVSFDINFLYDNFEEEINKKFANNFVDTIRLARKIYPNLENYKLENICNQLNIKVEKYHRAIADCIAANELLKMMKEKIIDENINIKELFKPKRWIYDFRKLEANGSQFDEEHIFYDKNVVFTGKLEKMMRTEAAQIVVNIGGKCENNITKKTNYLVVGDMDYQNGMKGNKTSKLIKAEQLILRGQDLQVISESMFYELIEENITEVDINE